MRALGSIMNNLSILYFNFNVLVRLVGLIWRIIAHQYIIIYIIAHVWRLKIIGAVDWIILKIINDFREISYFFILLEEVSLNIWCGLPSALSLSKYLLSRFTLLENLFKLFESDSFIMRLLASSYFNSVSARMLCFILVFKIKLFLIGSSRIHMHDINDLWWSDNLSSFSKCLLEVIGGDNAAVVNVKVFKKCHH